MNLIRMPSPVTLTMALVLGDFGVDQLPVACLQDVQIHAPPSHDASFNVVDNARCQRRKALLTR